MRILVGSYKENIFEVKIDFEKSKIIDSKIFEYAVKPSYLLNYDKLSYIYDDNNIQHIKINDQKIKLIHPSCHLSYDKFSNSIYVSSYHDGLLQVLNKIDDKFEITQEIKFKENSKIHYAEVIDNFNLVGVVDLGDDKFYLFENINGKLVEKTSITLDKNIGPRHFTYNKKLGLIYLVNELKPSVTTLKYENEKLEIIDQINLIDGAGSAIRITSDDKYVYTGVRFSNYIFGFEVKENGLLKIIQKVHTKGDHPRDFNLINNDKYLLVANRNSNNLTLFKIINGRLYLTDQDFSLSAGVSIICIE